MSTENDQNAIDAADPSALVLFPEMDEMAEVPEITEACWGILGKEPAEVMCASARMVVRRREASEPAVLACTLLAYDPGFELGTTLAEADQPTAPVTGGKPETGGPVTFRDAWDPVAGRMAPHRVMEFAAVSGAVDGPALLSQPGATVLIGAGGRAERMPGGWLAITLEGVA